MKPLTVSYGKTYNIGAYQSERIDIEMQVDKNETPQEVLSAAKSMVEAFHKENNKGLYMNVDEETLAAYSSMFGGEETITPQGIRTVSTNVSELRTAPLKTLTQEQLILQEIKLSDTVKKLSELKLLADRFPSTKEAYEKAFHTFC